MNPHGPDRLTAHDPEAESAARLIGTRTPQCDRSLMSVIRPDLMSPAERLAEIVEILAAGVVRLRLHQSSPLLPLAGESSLDCAGDQSGHANSETEKG